MKMMIFIQENSKLYKIRNSSISKMLNRTNCSIFKSANKTGGLDSTRFTTCTTTNFQNNTTKLENVQPSKLDLAYRKTRTLIDQLIESVQQKRQIARMGIKNFGDTNQQILDICQNEDIFSYQPMPTTVRVRERQQVSQIDLEKLELLKVIESQREHNQNLEKKCHKLATQNHFFRESCASTRLGQSNLAVPQPIRQKTRTEFPLQPQPQLQLRLPLQPQPQLLQPQWSMEASMLFAELQKLKEQNQSLREETLKLIKSGH